MTTVWSTGGGGVVDLSSRLAIAAAKDGGRG